MAKTYEEKQRWAATLEAIASSNQNTSKIKDIKVFGNIICQISTQDDSQLDVLCTWPVNNEVCINVSCTVCFSSCYCAVGTESVSLVYVYCVF